MINLAWRGVPALHFAQAGKPVLPTYGVRGGSLREGAGGHCSLAPSLKNLLPSPQQPLQQSLLKMQPVFRLVPNRTLGSVQNLAGDLLPPVGRQAV
jgi:hypothetical protein